MRKKNQFYKKRKIKKHFMFSFESFASQLREIKILNNKKKSLKIHEKSFKVWTFV